MPVQQSSKGGKFLNVCLALILFYVLYQVFYLVVTWVSFFAYAFANPDASGASSTSTVNVIATIGSIVVSGLITWLVFRKRFT